MEQLWSMSTTIREAERTLGFLATAKELEGELWTKANQMKFQILLIKNRQYLNDPDNTQSYNKLDAEQSEWLSNKSISMTYAQAESIFMAKNYEDPSMRGRQSMSPLEKLGLVYYEVRDKSILKPKQSDKEIRISDVGNKLLNKEISLDEFMLSFMLKYQYPNPSETSRQNWNSKPFINVLRLIKSVNKLCEERNEKAKGISKIEFGIFALSIQNYADVDNIAEDILKFRKELDAKPEKEKSAFVDYFTKKYLMDFNKPVKNTREYTDNMVRYVRLTKYIFIRGKYNHTYIDLEPRRMVEIDSILAKDNGSVSKFSKDEWISYLGNYNAYELPFETKEKLTDILIDITAEIKQLAKSTSSPVVEIEVPNTVVELKESIARYRTVRTELQNKALKIEFHSHTDKIDEAITALNDILSRNKAALAKKYSIELEKWTNIALNILNDAVMIKPNAPVGDDNEPIYTAPNGVADIECYYEKFVSICEVTMLTSRDQWYNEGQPVMRHLRAFENQNAGKPAYCLFVAPTLHVDTVNTFYIATKYEYESVRQKIVPITIRQLINVLKATKKLIESGRRLNHTDIQSLFEACTKLDKINDSRIWKDSIETNVNLWVERLIG